MLVILTIQNKVSIAFESGIPVRVGALSAGNRYQFAAGTDAVFLGCNQLGDTSIPIARLPVGLADGGDWTEVATLPCAGEERHG